MPEFELTQEQMKIIRDEIAASHNEPGGAVVGQVFSQYDGGQVYCYVEFFQSEHAKRIKAAIKQKKEVIK